MADMRKAADAAARLMRRQTTEPQAVAYGTVTSVPSASDGTVLVALDSAISSSSLKVWPTCLAKPGDKVIIVKKGTQWLAIGNLTEPGLPVPLQVALGGTGATSAIQARNNLGTGRWYWYKGDGTLNTVNTAAQWAQTNIAGWTLTVPNCSVGDSIYISWAIEFLMQSPSQNQIDIYCVVNGNYTVSGIVAAGGIQTGKSSSGVYPVTTAGSQVIQMRYASGITGGTIRLDTRNIFAFVLPRMS
jgi:hypothetical protein